MPAPVIRNDATALRKDVLALIKPYTASDCAQHQFTAKELAVIAAVAINQPTATEWELLEYICTHFKQYIKAALEAFANHYCSSSGIRANALCPEEQAKRRDSIIPHFSAAFRHYQVPLYPTYSDIPLEVEIHAGDRSQDQDSALGWAVDARAARIYLSKHLGEERAGRFDFLSLPAEIRNLIYEYTLSYPPLRLLKREGPCFETFHRELEQELASPQQSRCDTFHTGSLHELLAITQVNKQVYKEALPLFWSINEFCFPSNHALTTFVHMLRRSDPRHTPERQPLCDSEVNKVSLLTKLQVYINHWRESQSFVEEIFPDALGYLLQATRIERLTLTVSDGKLFLLPAWTVVDNRLNGPPYAYNKLMPWESPGMRETVRLMVKAEECVVEKHPDDDADSALFEYLNCELQELEAEAERGTAGAVNDLVA